MSLITLKYSISKPKEKKIVSFPKIYDSRKWTIFSFNKNILINQVNYSLYILLDNDWKELLSNYKMTKRVLLVGEYNKILPVYRFLESKNKCVYVCYV